MLYQVHGYSRWVPEVKTDKPRILDGMNGNSDQDQKVSLKKVIEGAEDKSPDKHMQIAILKVKK